MAIAAPTVFDLKQPDFGMTLTFMPIMIGMMFAAGAEVSHLLALVGYGLTAISMPMLFTYFQVNYPQATAGTLPYFILQIAVRRGHACRIGHRRRWWALPRGG